MHVVDDFDVGLCFDDHLPIQGEFFLPVGSQPYVRRRRVASYDRAAVAAARPDVIHNVSNSLESMP
eukprot:3098391-Karenia_brevis.AAC.1